LIFNHIVTYGAGLSYVCPKSTYCSTFYSTGVGTKYKSLRTGLNAMIIWLWLCILLHIGLTIFGYFFLVNWLALKRAVFGKRQSIYIHGLVRVWRIFRIRTRYDLDRFIKQLSSKFGNLVSFRVGVVVEHVSCSLDNSQL